MKSSAKASNAAYLVAAVVMAGVAVLSVTAIAMVRPGQDNMPLYLLITGFTTTTTAAVLAFMKAQETHLSVNSRLDQFIKSADKAARAEGELAGRSAARVDAKEDTK